MCFMHWVSIFQSSLDLRRELLSDNWKLYQRHFNKQWRNSTHVYILSAPSDRKWDGEVQYDEGCLSRWGDSVYILYLDIASYNIQINISDTYSSYANWVCIYRRLNFTFNLFAPLDHLQHVNRETYCFTKANSFSSSFIAV